MIRCNKSSIILGLMIKIIIEGRYDKIKGEMSVLIPGFTFILSPKIRYFD